MPLVDYGQGAGAGECAAGLEFVWYVERVADGMPVDSEPQQVTVL